MPAIAVEAPARIRPEHVKDRTLSAVAGAPKGFRNSEEHPLTAALDGHKISQDEFAAGEVFRVLYEARGRSGRDSTEFVVVSGDHTPFTDAQVNAIKMIQAIERNIENGPWVTIIRAFCGEGDGAPEACMKAGISNPRKTWENIRLSLSKLSTAVSRTTIVFRL